MNRHKKGKDRAIKIADEAREEVLDQLDFSALSFDSQDDDSGFVDIWREKEIVHRVLISPGFRIDPSQVSHINVDDLALIDGSADIVKEQNKYEHFGSNRRWSHRRKPIERRLELRFKTGLERRFVGARRNVDD